MTEKIYYHRNLPHWHPEGAVIFITWRLIASLPRSAQFPASLTLSPSNWSAKFRRVNVLLDRAATGPVWLSNPRVADQIQAAILRGEELRHYNLFAFVVMPNHVHVLLQPFIPLARVTNGIKGVSAKAANAILNRPGRPFWQDESFDHWIRTPEEFAKVKDYIEKNPVKAGLEKNAASWKWSSASPEFQMRTQNRTARSGCATQSSHSRG